MVESVNRTSYWSTVSNKYDDIKRVCSSISQKQMHKNIDEDIYHDTLIKVYDTIEDREFTEDELIKYIASSYRNNIFRELKYGRNKYISYDKPTEDISISDGITFGIDINILNEHLVQLFDANLVVLFYKWKYNDFSIKELEKESGISGLNYKLNKIKDEVIRFVGKDILDDEALWLQNLNKSDRKITSSTMYDGIYDD